MSAWEGKTGESTLDQLQADPANFRPATAPFDPRFPTTNQTRNCWQNYCDYHRCTALKGTDYEPCRYFERIYKILCPSQWVENWDDLMQAKRFAWDGWHAPPPHGEQE